jgi:signal transduction histidine kinase/CheY-like chemotaxis protein/HPt (histidine-containing phosphotransfer) domain-containing protein
MSKKTDQEKIEALEQQNKVLSGAMKQASLIQKRYKDSMGLLKSKDKRLNESLDEQKRLSLQLERFNKAMVGREKHNIELKVVINSLCRELGRPEPYKEEKEVEPTAPSSTEPEGNHPVESNAANEAIMDLNKKQLTPHAQPVDKAQAAAGEELAFTDLFDLDEIQKMQDTFAKAVGVASIITTTDGVPLTKPSNFSRLCNDIIRKTEKGCANCIRSDAKIGRFNPGGPIVQPCLSGGLWDGGASISVNNRHIANWLVGQVRNDQQDSEKMLAYAKEIGADVDDFAEALDEIQVMSVEQFTSVCDTLFLVANQMSNAAFQNIQQQQIIVQRDVAEKEREEILGSLEERVAGRTKEVEDSRAAALSLMEDAELRVAELDDAQLAMLNMMEDLDEEKLKAEGATKAKATFLASMSHEIRTPMNGVIGMVDLLRQTKLAGEQKQMLETISDSGQSLLTIINDILDFSKIEAGKMDLEQIPFSILEVVEGAAQTIAANATKKGLRLITYIEPDLPQFVTGDPVRVRQIIINLGGNAIKFTKEGQVVIRADRVESNDDQKISIRFSVIDQGIGLSDEGQAKLFKAYSQADSTTTREFGGTGLGLTICKTLTGLMGGEIGVNSKLGEGAEFFSIIPFNQSDKKVEVLKTTDLSGLRVLLINSNRDELTVLQQYLEYWKITVESNDNVQCVVSHCQTALDEGTPFDVVVLGPQWTQEELIAVADAAKEVGLKTRFVFLLAGKQQRAKKDRDKGVFVDIDPLRRATFISAVAVAAGRESPEVHYEEEVEDLTSVEKALSVEEARQQGTLILVAEDNATNRDVIGRQLDLLGYTCEMAEDGAIALDAWRSNDYGILLTDCNMPIMDGFELTNAIRKDEEGNDVHSKIIAITANALQGEAERCLESGMDDYMSKPIDMKELREKLHKWMPHAKESSKQSIRDEKTATDDTPLKESNGPIDENVLKAMFGDDEAMFREILVDFIEPSKAIIKEIQTGFEQHSAEDVKQGAHKLKSSALSIGAIALGELCQNLEAAGKNDDWAIIENGTPKLEELMCQVEEYVSQL